MLWNKVHSFVPVTTINISVCGVEFSDHAEAIPNDGLSINGIVRYSDCGVTANGDVESVINYLGQARTARYRAIFQLKFLPTFISEKYFEQFG
mmetsp:Transcript_34320/g.48757  ORF Transcript_34320/g.48757 Transcript_34320/m.48757 type:complete len:93 (+) Transcript_34320:256-534(+)